MHPMGPLRFVEIVLATFLAIPWGIILIYTPEDVLSNVRRITVSRIYLLPEWLLESFLIINGLVILLDHSKSSVLRLWIHGLLFGIWNLIAVLGLVSGITPVSLLISFPYLTIAFLHAGIWWRLTQLRE